MYGPGGNRVSKMTIDEYIKWQRWDEWPERADNPPLTVETVFVQRKKIYGNQFAKCVCHCISTGFY